MTDKPIPLDLTRFSPAIEGAREFLRLWMRPDGAVACFINPVPVGPDPASFGAALAEAVGHAAATYARAVRITEGEALARMWEGLTAARAEGTKERSAAPPPPAPSASPPPVKAGGPIIDFVPKQDPR